MIISMKKHLSVLGLFIRSSLFPVLGIMVLMGAVEVLFFHIELGRALTAHTAGIGVGFPSLERLLDRSAVNVYFALAFVLTTVILCLPGCAFRSKTQYTVARLSVTETAVTLWQAVCNILMYLLLASVQTLIAYGLCQYYMAAAPAEFTSTQTVFLALSLHDKLAPLNYFPGRGVKLARFKVLRLAKSPAMLIEAGFLNHPVESAYMATAHFRKKFAVTLAQEITAFAK